MATVPSRCRTREAHLDAESRRLLRAARLRYGASRLRASGSCSCLHAGRLATSGLLMRLLRTASPSGAALSRREVDHEPCLRFVVGALFLFRTVREIHSSLSHVSTDVIQSRMRSS